MEWILVCVTLIIKGLLLARANSVTWSDEQHSSKKGQASTTSSGIQLILLTYPLFIALGMFRLSIVQGTCFQLQHTWHAHHNKLLPTVVVIKNFPFRLHWTQFTFAFCCICVAFICVEETFAQRFFYVPLRYRSVAFVFVFHCIWVPMHLCSFALAFHYVSFPLR